MSIFAERTVERVPLEILLKYVFLKFTGKSILKEVYEFYFRESFEGVQGATSV